MLEFLVFLTVFNVITCDDEQFYKPPPVYKYRYETEDVLNTAASNVPMHGYHVVEGGYYPYEIGHPGVGIGNAALHGGISGPGYSGAIAGPGIGGFGGQQYILKPVGLVGPEFGGAPIGGGVGYVGMYTILCFYPKITY